MDGTVQSCAECLASISTAVSTQNGASLCQECAEQFYCTCAGCGGLIPQDEAVLRNGALCCVPCLAQPGSEDAAEALSEAELSALVAEFSRLHAEASNSMTGWKRSRRSSSDMRRHNLVLPTRFSCALVSIWSNAVIQSGVTTTPRSWQPSRQCLGRSNSWRCLNAKSPSAP